jgi:penicillin-binding protein 1A
MSQFFKRVLYVAIAFVFILLIGLTVGYTLLVPKLPDIQTIKETQFQVPFRIYSADAKLIAEFGDKRRIPIEYNQVPTSVINAFLASEDDRFFEHPGVDYQGILRAVYLLATTGDKAQGGSTITMQVARNFFLSNEKTYLRKINEIIISLQLEQILSKEEILTLYLNKIYLGNRAYGVAAAAKVYYGKSLDELTLAESAMIAGLPKAPSRYNPIVNPDRAQLRRNYVLRRMWEVGYISETDYQAAVKEPLSSSLHKRNVEVYAPYVAEMIRTQLIKQYGNEAYNMGLNVYTTIKSKHQLASNRAIQKSLLAYDRRHGYRGAIKTSTLTDEMTPEDYEQLLSNINSIGPLTPSLVISVSPEQAEVYIKDIGIEILELSSVSWARKQLSTNSRGKKVSKVSDVLSSGDQIYLTQSKEDGWRLAQLPQAQGAIVAVSPYDGSVTALNGGFDYFQNKFNRATQSRRQPGSGFKPFIYSAALEKGYTAATIINDAPVVSDNVDDQWRPENYSGRFFGPTRLRVALTHSRNLVSIRILRDIGTKYVIDYASKFGFDPAQLPNSLSLALGSGSAAPWDMARAYSALANGGYRVEPYIIQRVEDSSGAILMQAEPQTVCETCLPQATEDTEVNSAVAIRPAKRIMTPQNNYIMNSLLRDVVRYGTGRKAMSLGRNDLAGKTGTTNDQVDAWFNGFHPELVAIAWVGFDSPKSLGRYETGGRAALPMWIDFMKTALDDVPESPLQKPVNMVTVEIDPDTGLLSGPDTRSPVAETFREEYVPTETTPPTSLLIAPTENLDSPSETVDLF